MTLFGIAQAERLEQLENALLPMLVMLFGILTLVNVVSDANALVPMTVTGKPLIELGMLTTPVAPKQWAIVA